MLVLTVHFVTAQNRTLDGSGQEYEGFYIAGEGEYEGKVIARNASGHIYRPWDFSVTKNVLALFICALLLCWLVFPLVRWYKKKLYEAPRRVKGMMEFGVGMLYEELIVPILGKDARRFGPYLLTLFFFILLMNLMGLIVIFPEVPIWPEICLSL